MAAFDGVAKYARYEALDNISAGIITLPLRSQWEFILS